ncbi:MULTISPECIES: hypothetical protein [unclassified Agromyces]|uniref:hypothetical protein n=1 Tax=unclassified Agromyces TaxID=2639701 RepID=UPI0030146876
MDLANHHLAQSTQSYDAMHAERVNEYRRVAAERRAEGAAGATRGSEPLRLRIWNALVEAAALQRPRTHRFGH